MSALSQAYGFLCAQDVIAARSVCKAWRVPALWHQIIVSDNTHSLANLLTLCFPLNVKKCVMKGQDRRDDFNAMNRLQRLQTLEMSNGRDITAELMKETVEALPDLQNIYWYQFGASFDMHFASVLQPLLKSFSFQPILQVTTDQDIARISTMSHLKQLGLGCCANVHEEGLIHVKALTQLEKLTMYNCFAGIGLTHLASVLSMRSLTLVDCQVNTAELVCIATLPYLEELVLFANDHLTNEAFENVMFPKLKILSLRSCPLISDVGLFYLTRFTALEKLNITLCRLVTNNGLCYLTLLRNLRSLSMYGLDLVTDLGLKLLAAHTSLENLDMGSCNAITDTGLGSVAEMVHLTELSLESCLSITEQGLAHLTALVHLTALDFACTNIGDEGCRHVSLMDALRHLDIAACNEVTDVGLSYIAQVPNLRSLNVQNCNKVTGAALDQLQTAFPRLNLLSGPYR